MNFEAWRITFQSDAQAARAAYNDAERLAVKLAWELYCRETAGDMHVADSWEQLPHEVQERYLNIAVAP